MEVNRIVSPQPFLPKRHVSIDPIELRPIHHTVDRDFSSLFTSSIPDGYRHSDVHHAIVFWLETRFLRPDKRGDAQYAVVTPQHGRFTGTYDPARWSIESIHHSMVAMLGDLRYAKYQSKLLRHLWIQAKTGKTPIPKDVVSLLNRIFGKVTHFIPDETRMKFDLFFALRLTPATTRNVWLTKMMSKYITKMMPKPIKVYTSSLSTTETIVPNPETILDTKQVKPEQVLSGLLMRLVQEEVELALQAPVIHQKTSPEINLSEKLEKHLSFLGLTRYDDLTRKTIYQVILNYHTVERVLGTELISEVPMSRNSLQTQVTLFNMMRLSIVELFLCYEILFESAKKELLNYTWELIEMNPQLQLVAWRFELNNDASSRCKEYQVTYYARLGLIVIQDQLSGLEQSLRFKLSPFKQVLCITGKLFGHIVVAKSSGSLQTGRFYEQFRFGAWYGSLKPTEHHHYEGEWLHRKTRQKLDFSKHNQLSKNANSYYIMSQVMMVGDSTVGGHYRYQEQLPMPLSASGVFNHQPFPGPS